ncbi:uncharacterized protein [Clytia hemisphaerica]|uniref:uncharacterized protein n=1 Tax=Clytia hemisphaerica TaxID=252671 RepID=UPI0034D6F073
MAEKSEEVPLGVLTLNENKNEDMLEILKFLFKNYDSEKRSVIKMHLSSMDKGTYKCNTVRSGNPKALGDIKQRYEQIKEFFIMQLEALVVSAFMKQENMESVNDDCIPEHIQDANAKKRWLNGRISMMLETYVIPHFRTLIGSIKKEGDVDENDETINQAQNESTDKSVPACRLALLTPKMAHQLIWNRFFNRNGGAGMNILRDLRLEHINRFMKEMIKSQGMQNISDANVYKISKAYQGIREICDSMLQNVDVLQSSGHHSNTHKNEMFESVLKEFGDNNNFSSEPNKTLTIQFKKLQQNRFKNLETMVPWIKGHVRDWDVQNDSLCNFKKSDN